MRRANAVASAPPLAAIHPAAWRGLAGKVNLFNRSRMTPPKVATSAVSTEEAETTTEPEPIKLMTSDESEELLKIRHTAAHICAMATQKLFPDAKCTIGPWIDRGFYYDFDYKPGFSEQDFK